MPELPEVETIRRGLNSLIVGRQIRTVIVADGASKSYPNSPHDSDMVRGAVVQGVHRRAKLLLINVSSMYTLVIHLKMTGQLVYRGEQSFGAGHPTRSLVGELPDRSTRVTIEFADKSRLYFNDQRRFGWIKIFPSSEIAKLEFITKLGPEPLEDVFTSREFILRMRRRNNTTIKAAILDQTVLAGVGNIYADESLWGAMLHPATRVRDTTDEQLARLLDEIKYVMKLAIGKGGSTDRTYVDAEGRRGTYVDIARVFRREGHECPRCGYLIKKTRVANRGTHICPLCQQEVVSV